MSCEGCPFAGNCAPCKPQKELLTPTVGNSYNFASVEKSISNYQKGTYSSETYEMSRQASLTEVSCRNCGNKYRPANELSDCPYCNGGARQ